MSTVFSGLDTSDRIRGIIASRGKTQADLGKLLKLTPETISGRMKNNRWEVEELKVISKEFDVEMNDLV
jgi:transcriptional regulator with XRE-family HTH domain